MQVCFSGCHKYVVVNNCVHNYEWRTGNIGQCNSNDIFKEYMLELETLWDI